MEHELGQLLIIGKDNAPYAAFLEDLKETGYAAASVETWQQALHRLRTKSFDLILLDASLADMQDEHFMEHISTERTSHHLAILVLARPEDISVAEQWIKKGADDVLFLPFSVIIAKKRIGQYVLQKRLQEHVSSQQHEYIIAKKVANDLTEVILPIGIALSKIGNLDRLLERILKETKAVCNADGGTLYLREGDCLKVAIMLNDSLGIAINSKDAETLFPPPLKLHDEVSGEPNHTNVAVSTALIGMSFNISDIYRVKNFDFSGAKNFDQKYGYRSIASLTVPLKDHNGDVFGVLQLMNPKDPQTGSVIPFDTYMEQVAKALASQAALVLTHQFLLERQKELLRFEDELKIGQQIQTSFLPESILQPPGWEIDARLRSARAVSGDFYDVFLVDQNSTVCIVIADVCDKGVGAALFMVLIRTLIRAFAEYSMDGQTSLGSVVGLTNDYILQNHFQSNMFATLFIGMLNPSASILTYVNSGHPAPILIDSTGIAAHLAATGPVIGAFSDITFDEKQIKIEPGASLFAFTDGVTDARDPNGQVFSRQRLLTLLENPASSATELLNMVEEHVQNHISGATQFDDETMIVIRRKPRL